MASGRRTRRGRAVAGSLSALVALTLLISGCSSTDSGQAGGGQQAGTSSAAAQAQVTITPGADTEVTPKTPIVVKAANGTLSTVTVTSPKGNQVKGELSADKTTWTSAEPLGYDSTYQVAADAAGSDGKTVHQTGSVRTVAPKAQAFPALIPAPNSQPDFGVGQPIVVQFDQDITDKAAAEKALEVTATPQQEGSWYWISKKEVHYRPREYWQPGTTITLKANVYGVDLGGGVYGKTDREVTYKIHDSWIAKADGDTNQMQIFHSGQLVKTMPISMGKDETPTHLGPHVISFKSEKYTMDSCTYGVCPPDPKAYRSEENWSLRISNDGEFVHENPNSVGAQGRSNVSHGCINLNAENAKWFYQNLGLGDVVEVTNSGGQKLPVWDLYGDWELSWDQWQQGSALK
ncbi:L,D-transpeptidase [Goodfellowiella coeruleoviolacea]|uniref:Lipoprotein-anchoring transpeptidase ErfK/SrfK n=1 Tax=Goodfellowiella coeruleoviolacea TaxID=334858 RepID=A0AAE3GF03_9PSEU|nr:Ig-like domain-containing protein [Goodfellowiella coeruleoviolacea]MCP2166518.1 Lipoprotein-anchoring transpeptidase ErfK/SrfK [Goodfellowiella coeruleoviolacea]